MTVTSRQRKALLIVVFVVCGALLLAAVNMLAMITRVGRVGIPATALTTADPGETWVIVGSDNRDYVPGGAAEYGTGQTDGGDHADIVLVFHKTARGVKALGIPRDLMVQAATGDPQRLTLTLNQSPGTFVSAMCLSFGIPTDHLVIVHMGALIGVVDAVGGVDVQSQYAMRDAYSKLEIPAGPSHLDGTQALAYVRTRHPEYLIDGQWVPLDAMQGSLLRPRAATEVLQQVATKLMATRNPVTWQRAAWSVSGGVVLDSHTSLFDLPQLIGMVRTPVTTLPISPTSGDIIDFPTGDTYATLTAAGFPSGGCHYYG